MIRLFSLEYTPKGRKITFCGFRFSISLRSRMQMFFRPLISVIVPVYNVEKYLPQCLDSLIKQTFLPFEIICVNDGSTDGCNEILSRYAAKDRRIRLICQNNRGLSAARNAGLKKPKDNMFCLLTATTCCTPKLCRHYTGKLPATMRTFAFSATLRTPTTALKPPTCPPHITEKTKTTPLPISKSAEKYSAGLPSGANFTAADLSASAKSNFRKDSFLKT